MSATLIKDIRKYMRGEVKKDESMAKHTSFGIGGPADVWAQPRSRNDLATLIDLCEKRRVPFMVIGNGTNILVRDGGIDGVVISLKDACGNLDVRGNVIVAGAAVSLGALTARAVEHSLQGLEFCTGIPGTVGGALTVNAGGWGRSMGDVFTSATILDLRSREMRTIGKNDVAFEYRTSSIASLGIVLEAELTLEAGDRQAIVDRMKQYRADRTEHQPIGVRSAGCVFRNPTGKPAGALIDESGLKGRRHGSAMVSPVHANFIVNTGSATADDVLALIAEIREHVHATVGIELEEEIQVVGRS
jgi:UDP-N-acetylmuramate dehydrogenase